MDRTAWSSTMSLFILSVVCILLLSSASPSLTAASTNPLRRRPEPCKTMTLYFHDIRYTGKNLGNATSVMIATAAYHHDKLSLGPVNSFGDTVAFNDTVTVGPDLGSTAVGRAEGVYVYTGKEALGAWFTWTVTLNHEAYGFGSFSIVGHDPLVTTRDMPVVGGTGDFFMTRGIVTLSHGAVEFPVYFRLQLLVKLYECYHT